ncbi:MAG: cellulase family glycosylhydrolase [Solirubrobacterales bacterium]
MVGLAIPPASQAAPTSWFGYNDDFAHHDPWAWPGQWPNKSTLSGAELEARLAEEQRIQDMMAHAQRGGSKTIRYPVLWSRVEANRGTLRWNYYDYVFQQAGARGIRPILVLMDAPCWALDGWWACKKFGPGVQPPYGVNGQEAIRPNTVHNGSFLNFAATATDRYGSAAGMEIWNEPNLPKNWAPSGHNGNSDNEYAELVVYGAFGVIATNPNMPVLAGGVSPTNNSGTWGTTWKQWLDSFYRHPIYNGVPMRDWFQFLSAHPYSTRNPNNGPLSSMKDRYDDYREVKNNRRDNSPIWVTEVGLTTNDNYDGSQKVSEANQGAYLANVEDTWTGKEMFGMIIHRLYDTHPPNARDNSFDAGAGTMRLQLTPLPPQPAQPKYAFCLMASRHGQASC